MPPPGTVEISDGGRAARALWAERGWELELELDRDRPDAEQAAQLLGGLVDALAAHPRSAARWRVASPTPAHEAAAAAAGFSGDRVLWQMRRPLPIEEESDLPTRPFRPGVDDEAWLEVNNAAFWWHPEQGGWSQADLAGRLAEPWFDPRGFLLHEAGGEIDGFCWTKEHHDTEPPLGEIYVIAVRTESSGTGLGRRLVIAGLDHLGRRGLRTAMLYTEAGNLSAVRLYLGLGFEVHEEVKVFEREVGGAHEAPAQTSTPSSEPMP